MSLINSSSSSAAAGAAEYLDSDGNVRGPSVDAIEPSLQFYKSLPDGSLVVSAPSASPSPNSSSSSSSCPPSSSLPSPAPTSTPSSASLPCPHEFLDKWGRRWHCSRCDGYVDDRPRVALEEEELEKIVAQDLRAFGGGEQGKLAAAAASRQRGVTVEWLVEWTSAKQCWDWPTWRVRRDIVRPETKPSGRCRYVDLPAVRGSGAVGEAGVFASHCWGARWGDLVAAVCDGAAPGRRVWVDVLAVRQWPGNTADMDFGGVVRLCDAVLLACTSLPEVAQLSRLEAVQGRRELSGATRKKIAFFRVWCLVEIAAAMSSGVPVVMKGGRAVLRQEWRRAAGRAETVGQLIPRSGGRAFASDFGTLDKMLRLVDVEAAEATVEEDRARILQQVRQEFGGMEAVNSLVRGAITGCLSCARLPTVQAAACGELDGFRPSQLSPTQLAAALRGAAAGGYGKPLQLLLRRLEEGDLHGAAGGLGGKVIDAADSVGSTALMLAATGGHVAALRALLEAKAAVGLQRGDGVNALMFAATGGHVGALRVLLEAKADVHAQPPTNKLHDTCLTLASRHRHYAAVRFLCDAMESTPRQRLPPRTRLPTRLVSPAYSPTSPAYSPTSPAYSPTSPAYSPTSPSGLPIPSALRPAEGGASAHCPPEHPCPTSAPTPKNPHT